jgi:lipopolysaccharide/colanic/teichoic acid biosynthesis glycosyltransferase
MLAWYPLSYSCEASLYEVGNNIEGFKRLTLIKNSSSCKLSDIGKVLGLIKTFLIFKIKRNMIMLVHTQHFSSMLQFKNISRDIKAYDGKHHGLPFQCQRIIALAIVIATLPLILLTMICIRIESKGSCFYSQVRVGKYGRQFKMYKFRSMYIMSDTKYKEPTVSSSDRQGVCLKFKQDPRVTSIGRFIRKYSIDELPQLFNVILGDMALVGPRPALVSEVKKYSNDAYNRLNGYPGISGLWQVSGRADTDFETQVKLDTDYLKQQSIGLDLKIMIATIPCIILAKGAY